MYLFILFVGRSVVICVSRKHSARKIWVQKTARMSWAAVTIQRCINYLRFYISLLCLPQFMLTLSDLFSLVYYHKSYLRLAFTFSISLKNRTSVLYLSVSATVSSSTATASAFVSLPMYVYPCVPPYVCLSARLLDMCEGTTLVDVCSTSSRQCTTPAAGN